MGELGFEATRNFHQQLSTLNLECNRKGQLAALTKDCALLAARLAEVEAERQSLHTENLRLVFKDQEGAKEVARLRAVEAERDRMKKEIEEAKASLKRIHRWTGEAAQEEPIISLHDEAETALAALSPTQPKEPNR